MPSHNPKVMFAYFSDAMHARATSHFNQNDVLLLICKRRLRTYAYPLIWEMTWYELGSLELAQRAVTHRMWRNKKLQV